MSTIFSGPFHRNITEIDRIADALTGTDDVEAPTGNRAADSLSRIADFFENNKVVGGGSVAKISASTAQDTAGVVADLNALIVALKDGGIMERDTWNVSVLACTSDNMPTANTKSNSGHATVTIDETDITITLDCKVSALKDCDHGSTWGTHKWLGFGVRTGLASVVGVKFEDDTGAKATLASGDDSEASTLGLSAGDFILYIKAEQPEYLTGDKGFILSGLGYEPTTFTMKIVEG